MRRFTRLLTLLCLCACLPVRASDRTYGEIARIDADKKSIVVSTECSCGSDKLIELTFNLQDKTKLLLNGKEVKLADLKTGDDVDIDFEDPRDNVLKVAARRAEDDKVER